MKFLSFLLLNIMLAGIFLLAESSFGQGMSRSTGLGIRLSFWNVTQHPTRVNVSGYGKDASVDISGVGTTLYFFSRVHNNYFLEFSLGGVAGVREQQADYLISTVEATAVTPILLGLRYDLLSTKFPSAIQPYLAVGGGPYWIASIRSTDPQFESEQTVESDLNYGVYAGGGSHLLLTSWLALNFMLKYHFVDWKFEQGYSGLEFGLGFGVMWGRQREVLQIEEIQLIVKDIYPTYYQFYRTYPIAFVAVKNVAGYPIEVNVKSHIRPFSERVGESGFIRIEKGKTNDIPVTAIFGKRLLQVNQREPAILDIEIEARAGKVLTRQISAEVTIHTRNSWNGEMDKLGLFVTPDDESILQLGREMIQNGEIDASAETAKFEQARVIFNRLVGRGLHYSSDPNIPFYQDDRVQYATETLAKGSGDCDDLVVLYGSLLESLGIRTAFVETRDPDRPIAHLFLLFDTGLEPSQALQLSSNEKRLVVREQPNGRKTIWIPVETTLIDQDFEAAWKSGATQYLQDGLVRGGLEQGWVTIIDLE